MDWWLKSYWANGRFELPERPGEVTMKGAPLTLIGEKLHPGLPAPFFRALDPEMKEVTFDDFKGKPLVVASVPSLDTSVCDLEAKHFHRAASELGEGVGIVVISMDLPFAQKRWCGANGITGMKVLSDHRDGFFGYRYGVLVKELRLLARAVFVIDREGMITYVQVVPEMSDEPDYDRALLSLRETARK